MKFAIKYLSNDESTWFKIYEHFIFYKAYQNYDVISQKALALSQKWSHGTNFGMLLCIKSYLYKSFNI